MVTYSEMTFGTGGKAGTITPISKSQFESKYGLPRASNLVPSYQGVSYIPGYSSIPQVRPTVPGVSIPTAQSVPTATTAIPQAIRSILDKPSVTYDEVTALFDFYGLTAAERSTIHRTSDIMSMSNALSLIHDTTGKVIDAETGSIIGQDVVGRVSVNMSKVGTIPVISDKLSRGPETSLIASDVSISAPEESKRSTIETAIKSVYPDKTFEIKEVPVVPGVNISWETPVAPATPEGFEAPAAPEGFGPSVKSTDVTGDSSSSTSQQGSNVPTASPVVTKAKWTEEQRKELREETGLNDEQLNYREQRGDKIIELASGKKWFEEGTGIPDDQAGPITRDPNDPTSYNPNVTVSILDDGKPAETEAELAVVYREALTEYNPDGEHDGTNDMVIKYFAGLVPLIVQGEIDPKKISRMAFRMEELRDGSSTTKSATYVPGVGMVGKHVQDPFDDLTYNEQCQTFQDFMTEGADEGVPIGFTLSLINPLLESESTDSTRNALTEYVKAGGLERDLTKFGTGDPIKTVLGWVKSDSGLTTIGAVFGTVSAVGGFIAGGPVGGATAMGMSGFLTTEFKNAFGQNPYLDKAKLQAKNLLASDHKYQYNETFKSTENQFFDFSKYYKDWDEPTRARKLTELKEKLKAQGANLREETVFLDYMGIYGSELTRYNNLKDTLNGFDNVVDELTGKLTGVTLAPAQITLIPPTNGWIEGTDFKTGKDATYNTTKENQGGMSYKVYDGKGNLVKTEDLSYYPGNIIEKDYTSLLSFESTKADKEPLKYSTFVILLPANADMQLGTNYIPPEDYDRRIYTQATEKEQTAYKITQEGKKDNYGRLYFSGEGYHTVPIIMQDDTYKEQSERGSGVVFFTGLDPSAKVWIDGEEVKTEGLVGYQSKPGQDANIKVMVQVPGWDLATNNIFIKAGETQSVSLAPLKQTYVRGPSGGGGGGGGGGSSGGTISPAPTMIVFGTSLEGCKIWLDDVEIMPIIGTEYAITPGYHAVKALKTGFLPYEKNVYCMEERSIEVNAVFEVDPSYTAENPTPDTSSDPYATYIVFGTSTMGCDIWLDDVLIAPVVDVPYQIPYGIHGIVIEKAGKDPWVKNVQLFKGDTLTVSPVFSDAVGSTTGTSTGSTATSQRVFINSNPDGAKIMINDGFTGQWTPGFVDLEPGLYKLTTTKTGYQPRNSWVYVGDTIAFGDTALQLANIAGVGV